MGFFLLGRGREAGELRLISTEVFAGRSEAIEALTKLSGEPEFEHRDAEVFVLDLDTGMPVVLVASAAPAAAEPVIVEPAAEEPEAEVEVAEEPASEEPEADAGVWEAPIEPIEPAVAEAMEAEASAEPGEAADDLAEEQGDGLAGALKRAAGALESEGIVAPESIGPAEMAEPEVEPDAESEPETIEEVLDQPWLAETGEPAADDSAPILKNALDLEQEFEPVAEPVAEPDAEPEPDAEVATEPVAEPAVSEGADAAWPWDTASATASEEPSSADESTDVVDVPAGDTPAAADVSAFVPDPFEEPATDPGDYLKVQIGDDSSSMGRTVVMGAYAEETAAEPEPQAASGTDTEIDSMLADLGRVGDAGDSPGSDLADLTCEDCVYVNTCPNKEGLDPSKCGNFQWRSV